MSDVLRIKEAKEALKEMLDDKLETPVSDNDLLGAYPSHIEDVCDAYDKELSDIADRVSDDNDLITGEETAIKTALEGKGVTIPSGSTIEDLPALIANIPSSSAPYKFDATHAWMGVSDGVYTYEAGTSCRIDIYEIENGVKYFCSLGNTVGTRFRIAAYETDPSLITSGKAYGTALYGKSTAPLAFENTTFDAPFSGYLAIQKDNDNTDGIPTYLLALR